VTLGAPSVNTRLAVHHNTYVSDAYAQSAIQIGEGSNGVVGWVPELKSNLAWSKTAAAAKLAWYYWAGTPPSNVVSGALAPDGASHNAAFRAVRPPGGTPGYDIVGAAPSGATDVIDVDPLFTDPTRNIATWSASLGGANTMRAPLDMLARMNDDAGYDGRYTIDALFAWVRAGWQPRAAAYYKAGHDVDGTMGRQSDIGAVPMASVDAPAGPPLSRRSRGERRRHYVQHRDAHLDGGDGRWWLLHVPAAARSRGQPGELDRRRTADVRNGRQGDGPHGGNGLLVPGRGDGCERGERDVAGRTRHYAAQEQVTARAHRGRMGPYPRLIDVGPKLWTRLT
jgi:hypothetical protein